jgi:uncharacterized protein
MTEFVPLTSDDKSELLQLARYAVHMAVNRCPLPELVLENYSTILQAPGASFVTITQAGKLRGCIGAIEAYQPLVQDVCEHALSAALYDYRFSPIHPQDVPLLKIEISRLSPLLPLHYHQPEDLLQLLRPFVDGVVFEDGKRRATFLPQVWEKIDTVGEFLDCLAEKMCVQPDYWRQKKLAVFTYQVEKICE